MALSMSVAATNIERGRVLGGIYLTDGPGNQSSELDSPLTQIKSKHRHMHQVLLIHQVCHSACSGPQRREKHLRMERSVSLS